MDKTRMGKRVASLLLSLVMMLSLLPTAAYAAMGYADDTQGAIVSENGTDVSDDSNSSGGTGDLQVEDSEGNGDTGAQQVGDSSGSGTADDTTGAEGGADPTDSVNGNDSADPQDDGDAVMPTAANVAKVGDTEYATLDKAIAALSSSSYTLELLDETAWDLATPVYWAAGSESGYAATLADALTAAYMANAGGITIVCRPGADVGKLTHGHVADDITIYGNNAYISSGECELEVDTFMYSRDTGKQVTTGGAYLEKDITVTAYELDNLGVWGERHTDHKVTVNLTDCDSVNGITVQRVYISGTTGVNDITLTGCDFGTKATSVYSNADGAVVIDNCSFTGAQVPVNFNHKANGAQTVTVRNSTFTGCGDNGDWKQFAAPVRFVNSGSGKMDTPVDTCTFTDTVGGNGDILLGDGRVGEKSNDVKLTVENTAANVQAQQPGYYAKDGTTDESKQGTKNVAASDTLTTSVTQLMPSSETTYVAEVNGVKYKSLQAAIDKATEKATVILLADTRENVTISTNRLTLDLNGHTLNGGQVKAKPALTVTARNVIVKDSSAAKTGTIMREDTAENSGVSSHYVIDIQGDNAFLKFEGGNVKNNSGNTQGKGASLVRVGDDSVSALPQLTIAGGTFTQDNFIVIKVDRGTFYLTGGTLNSANSYAIEDWHRATIKGGTVNGTVAVWTYSGGHNSDLSIIGGTVNGNEASVSYDKAEGKVAKVSITGGTVNGTLGTYTYGNGLIPINDATKATIAVTGGTFKEDPTKYVVEDSAITPNADGTYGVAKAYLAKVGDTSYYTMDEAFKAQTASSKDIVLLRDYTTGSTFNSGSINRTVDLNGHTWTCTGTDANSAAFEINYPDATLTVKNGKVVSSQLVGLIPSAMGGTITYVNSTLVFDGVVMTTTAHSGIETNGNNSNDTVTLRNSTLNVPNGFGIYFPSSGTLTIDNSVINAKTMGVQVCSGSLNISGADTAINVSGDGIDKTINDGAIEDGAAISIVNRAGYKDLAEIKVEGGKFTAKGDNAAVKAYDWANQTENAFTQAAKVSISGGTFSSAVDKSLCADGYIPTQNADGTYGVKEGADGYVEDENGNVTISTAEGLFYFAKKVNAGNNFAGKTVTLANNIDLNNEKWTPIGIYGTQATWFKGTFDGQNHAVTGLKIYDNSWNKQKNSNDSYPIYAEKDGKGGVLMEGMTAARDNSLIMLEDDLNYVTGDLSKVRIMAGSSVTQAQIDALAVASVGDSKYQSLAEAIDAAQDGQTVTLLADAAEDVVISKSITLDLGGKTLTNTNGGKATISVAGGTVTVKNGNVVGGTGYYNIEVTKGSNANLTLTDVTATAGNNGSSMIDNWGTLTITSGTYTGGLNVVKSEEGSKLTITGGTFTGNYATNGYTAVILVYGDTTISGGEFIQSATNGKWNHPQVVMTGVVEGYTAITRVTGGNFVNNKSSEGIFHGLGKATSDNFEVSGGTFNKAISEGYCADGFIPTKNADGTYGVKVGQYVAQIGSKKYETLADAIRLATKGKTITLLCDVEQNTQLTINKSITLDLNGKTIKNTMDIWGETANAILSITNGAKVTITGNGTIDAKENDCYTINVVKGDLTIENGTFYGNVSVVQVEEGTLSVKGGTFDLHQKWEGSSMYLFNCIDEAYVDGSANVAISGGTFVGFDPNVSPEQKVDGKVPSFAAPGVGITKNENGSFTAVDGMTAQILDEDGNSVNAYNTLAEAVAAAQDGQTVTLLADVEQNAQLTIDKSITLDLNGKTIKISGYTAEKAQVSVKGNLTIQDSSEAQTGKICSDYTGTAGRVVSVENGGKLTIAGGTITTEGMSGLSGSAVYIASGAEVNMTGGAVKVDAKRGNVAMNVKGSTGVFTMSGGSVIAEAGDGTETYITAISGSSGSTIQISAGTVSGPQALLAGSSATTITGGNFTGSITVKNGSISGGTFDRALDKKACAAGYVPTQNGDGTYGVEIGMFTVMVTSRTTGSNSPVANVAGGGSNITYAQGTTVTASAISGYKFVGWFVNEYTGTPYSTDLTCEVKPTDDCTMIAVYEPISGGVFALEVSASKFTVNDGATQRSYMLEEMPIGTQVTVVFKGSENFLYWVNESGKVVSTSKTYTFSMGSATTLKAVYAEKEENQTMVVFISHTQQVISSKGYTDTQEIQFPEPPIKMGATFVRWSMTEAEIRAAMATTATGIIVVEPVYEFSAGSYTVTVNYPNDETATYTATVGKITPVTAKSIDGKVFKCWKNGDTVLGYTETLKVAPRGDLILTAEYVDAGTTVDRLPVIALTEISASQQGAKYAVSFTATRSVPDGYTVTEQGVLVSTDSRYGETGALDAMKLDADGVKPDDTKILKATNTDATGVTVLNGIVSAADRTVYGRAYMILRDSSGTMVYVYSDTILSGSYNSLTTNGGN